MVPYSSKKKIVLDSASAGRLGKVFRISLIGSRHSLSYCLCSCMQ